MREEVQRISKLVAEGKLSPEDAADLIDAFYGGDRPEESAAAEEAGVPPPPPPGAKNEGDPFKSLVESIEKLTKEGMEAINWNEVSKQARDSAKKGFQILKVGIEDISKGKVHLGWLTSQETRQVTLPLAVPAGKTLKIENATGDVKIVGGFDVGSVAASARFRGATVEDARSKADEYTLIIEESDHMVLIRQPDVSGLTVDLEIQLAGHASVELRAEAGDVEVLETGGGCRITSRTGDVHLRGLNGPIEVTAENGDISVENSTTPGLSIENKSGGLDLNGVIGNINARTATGDVNVKGSNGKVVSIESVSGDVHVDFEEPVNGTVNVRTVNGDASLSLASGSDCRVSLSTLRGSIMCGLDLQDEARSEQRITGKLGNGTGSLDLSAVTGDLTLELRDATV